MNKRTIITLLVSIFLVIGAFFGAMEFLSYKDVSITFKKPNVDITIYTSGDTAVTSLSSDTTTRLKEGSYYYIPKSENYSSDKVYFEVRDNQAVEISPSYSSEFLAALLSKEQSAIRGVLIAAYPEVASRYVLGDERLAHHGEWYSVKIMQRVSGGNEPDVYRAVLKKEGNTWVIAATPQLILNISKNPSIPDSIIRQVNEPLSNEAYALLYPA